MQTESSRREPGKTPPPRVMRTAPCRNCGEPTHAFVTMPNDEVECEDCSGEKRIRLEHWNGPDRTRRGEDPALADLRYDGLR